MIIILLVFSLLSSKISFCMENQYPSLPDDFSLALAGVAMEYQLFPDDDLNLALVDLKSSEAISGKAQPSQVQKSVQFAMPSIEERNPIPKPVPKPITELPLAPVLPPVHRPNPEPLEQIILSADDKAKIASIQGRINELIKKTPTNEYYCTYCGVFFIPSKTNPDPSILHNLKDQYKNHLKTHERTLRNGMEYKQKHHSCETCDKKFFTYAILGFHKKTCSQLKQK